MSSINEMIPSLQIVAANGVPYFTPMQYPPAGTAVVPQPNGKLVPTLFQPFKIRGMQMQNRILVCHTTMYRMYRNSELMADSFRRFANTRPKMASPHHGTLRIVSR